LKIEPATFDGLREADWHEIGIRLCAYASWKARNYSWRTGSTLFLAAGNTPEDIAREAILRVLDGRRRWEPERGALLPFLQGVVDSLMSHLAASADNSLLAAAAGPAALALAAWPQPEEQPADDAVEQLRTTLQARREQELLVVLDAVQACAPKPAAIAAHLGVAVSEVNNRLKRLRRIALQIVEKNRARSPGGRHDG